jgi:antitoxin HicB
VKNKHIGSTFSSFLEEEGIREEVDLRAKKKILAEQILAKMQQDQMTRTELAERMQTSRTVVNRLLDPTDTSFTFGTLAKASHALDLDLLVSLEVKAKSMPRG